MIQDPITESVAEVIGMSVEQAENSPSVAARKAAAVLRKNGFVRRYNNAAWERGQRWFAPGSSVPMPDKCSTTILGMAMIDGLIAMPIT